MGRKLPRPALFLRFTAMTPNDLEGQLEEEHGGAVLPGGGHAIFQVEVVSGIKLERPRLCQPGEKDPMLKQVAVEGLIEGEETPTEVEAAVEALNGENGRQAFRQV